MEEVSYCVWDKHIFLTSQTDMPQNMGVNDKSIIVVLHVWESWQVGLQAIMYLMIWMMNCEVNDIHLTLESFVILLIYVSFSPSVTRGKYGKK